MSTALTRQRVIRFGRRRLVPAALLAVVASWSAGAALADDKKVCLDSYVEAQRLKQKTSLIEAREKLILCSRETCPATIRDECVQWLSEVDRSLPTVVLLAKDADGRDIVDLRVTVDGEPFVDRADGKPVPIDPGVRVFRFETPGFEPLEEQAVIRASVKDRVISVVLNRIGGTALAEAQSSPASAPPDSDVGAGRPIPTLVYVLGGVGVVGVAGFGTFTWRFSSQRSDLDGCKPFCSEDDINAADTSRKIAFVSLGVGVVALGAATALYLTRPEDEGANTAYRGLLLDAGPTPGGAAASLSGVF